MKQEKRIQLGNLIVIVASFLAVTLLILSTEGNAHYWHLFAVPLLIATFTYNFWGGLVVWFLAAGVVVVWSMIFSHSVLNYIGTYIDIALGLAVAVGLGIYSMNVKKTKTLLEKLSEKDGLTGLENYSHFAARLTEEKNRSDRYATPFSLILMDIDHFKRFNDSYGHEAGNEVLKTIAATIRAYVRNVDLAARYGGEELAVILSNANSEGAFEFAKRLHQAIGRLSFNFAGGQQNITVSMGVSSYPKDAGSETEMIVYADQALYRAKAKGRNQICIHSTPPYPCPLDKVFV